MSAVESAVIAAAGLGSRLGLGKPKCLLEFGGKSILQHQLWLLRSVPDVRVVVGFEEALVMDAVRRLRPDVIIVRNAAYRTTTTLDSYSLGATGVRGNCLFLDGDITFGPASFARFLDTCRPDRALIGVTALKTQDAVHIGLCGWASHLVLARTPFTARVGQPCLDPTLLAGKARRRERVRAPCRPPAPGSLRDRELRGRHRG